MGYKSKRDWSFAEQAFTEAFWVYLSSNKKLRLGQIICNALPDDIDLFYVENDHLARLLRASRKKDSNNDSSGTL